MDKIKEKSAMYLGIVISILLGMNGFLLKEFYQSSTQNDKEMLRKINEIDKEISVNREMLNQNKSEHKSIMLFFEEYHPRKHN